MPRTAILRRKLPNVVFGYVRIERPPKSLLAHSKLGPLMYYSHPSREIPSVQSEWPSN